MVSKSAPPSEDEADSPESNEALVIEIPAGRSLPPIVQKFLDRLKALYERFLNFIWSREPRLVPSIVTFIGVLLLLGLGTWQLARLDQKNAMLATIKAELAEPVVDLRTHPPQDDASWKKLNYRAVVLKGTWLNVHQFKMIPRTYEGQVGYHLVLPLKLEDDRVVFVNRGFVPDNAGILPPEDEKVFAVQGVLRIPESLKPWATPENLPSQRVWTWTDLAAMRHEIGVNSVAPVILYEARKDAQESYPIGGQLPVPSHNRHRQYALIWYALALALVGIWMIASNPKEKLKPVEPAAANDDERLNDPVARRGLYPEATD